jgi:glyoxylase-like metal-dependent hydrolase (beta-lactamase superfamily II)
MQLGAKLRRSTWLLCLLAGTSSAQPAETPFTLKQLAPNVWAAINNPAAKVQGGSNAGIVIGDDGVIVIDTFVSAAAATELLIEIRKLTNLPVRFAVNTHFHADHVAGNKVFLDAGAEIVAHHNVRSWVHTENLKLLPPNAKPELKTFVEGIASPTLGYEASMTVHLGSRAVQVLSYPGHTGGDSVVVVPDAKVAFAGDLFWRNFVPNMVNASTRPWIETLDSLVKNASGFTFVPGHGDLGSAQDVTAFREYLSSVLTFVTQARKEGKTGKALTESVLPLLRSKFGQWQLFNYLAPLNVEQMEAELSGTKVVPRPVTVR